MNAHMEPSQTLRDLRQAEDIISQRLYELRNMDKRPILTICKLSVVWAAIALVAKTKVH